MLPYFRLQSRTHQRPIRPSAELQALLRDWKGEYGASPVVLHEGKRWILKSLLFASDQFREILASRIGEGIVNIAAVRPAVVTNNQPALKYAVYSRLAYDYSPRHLPLKDLDSAVAGELVFSTLFRRRDAHEYNRAYVNGIPIFFDQHVAFGCELMRFEKIEHFLGHNFDEGYAGRWRACKIEDPAEIGYQFRNCEWGARHFYISEPDIRRHAQKITIALLARIEEPEDLLKGLEVDAHECARILEFFEEVRKSARDDVEVMLTHVFRKSRAH